MSNLSGWAGVVSGWMYEGEGTRSILLSRHSISLRAYDITCTHIVLECPSRPL